MISEEQMSRNREKRHIRQGAEPGDEAEAGAHV
jgi:hypothetical protein